MNKDSRIFLAGHNGFVGSELRTVLYKKGFQNIICKSHNELDLTDNKQVDEFFYKEKPEYIFLAAAKVGGIKANINFPVEFLLENLKIELNVIECAHRYKTNKLLFLGSSCIYPRNSKQPIKEEYLLNGLLEPTNEGFALAKISGIKLCQYYKHQYGDNFISAIPSNIYGPGDSFDLEDSHVLSALISKMHTAKLNKLEFVDIWGSGKPLREFIYISDIAEALIKVMECYDELEPINIGSNQEISIRDLALIIKDIVGFKGELYFDESKPDGMFRKLLDNSKINSLGWSSKMEFNEGIRLTYNNYLNILGANNG